MVQAIDQRCKQLLAISDTTFGKFRQRHRLNQEISELFYPMRADFTETLDYGDFAASVLDGTTVLARETIQNAIKSMLRQGEWFAVGTGDPRRDKEIANSRALKYATERMFSIIRDPRVQFDVATDESDGDWAAFGNPVLSVEMSAQRQHMVVKAHHPRDVSWMENADGIIDCVYRDIDMTCRTVGQMKASGKWTGELHHNVKQAIEHEPGKMLKIRHILMPTEDMYASDAKKMREIRHPYISIYVDVENQCYLNERGAAVFNYVIPRWKRAGKADATGWSPLAVNALGDARMLQSMALTIMEQGEKAVDPPILASAELFSRDINIGASGLTQVDIPEGAKLQDVMTVLQTGEGLRMGVELKQDVRALIAEAWLLNKLFLPNLRDMRELEVMVRTEEFRRAALPFFQPIESQYHSALLGTIFEMGVHMGQIEAEAFPEELTGEGVKFTFNSPLNEAEGMKIVGAYKQAVELITVGSTVDATINNMFDFRTATKDAVQAIPGSNPDWLLSDIKVREKDQEAERVKLLQQATSIAQGGAGAVADVSNAAMAAQNAGLMPPQAANAA